MKGKIIQIYLDGYYIYFFFIYFTAHLDFTYDSILYRRGIRNSGITVWCTNTHYAFRNTKSLYEWHPVAQWQTGENVLAKSRALYYILNCNAARQYGNRSGADRVF